MYSLVPVWYTKCVFIQKGKTCQLFVERLHTQLRLETSDRHEGWVSIHKRYGLTSVLHEREKYPSTSISDGMYKSLAPLPFRMPSLRLVKELPPSQRNGGTHPTILSKTSNPLMRPIRPRRSISPRPWFLLPSWNSRIPAASLHKSWLIFTKVWSTLWTCSWCNQSECCRANPRLTLRLPITCSDRQQNSCAVAVCRHVALLFYSQNVPGASWNFLNSKIQRTMPNKNNRTLQEKSRMTK